MSPEILGVDDALEMEGLRCVDQGFMKSDGEWSWVRPVSTVFKVMSSRLFWLHQVTR